LQFNKDTQRSLPILVLVIVLAASLTQSAGAAVFFNPAVTFQWKSNPELRTRVELTGFSASTPIGIILVFAQVPTSEDLEALYSLGTVQTFTGHVATMTVAASMLPRLAAMEFVSHIDYPRMLKPELDVSVPEILADKVWKTVRDANGNPVNGTGVIVGIADTGIDYLHKDFYLANGTSKVLYIWDQSMNMNPPAGFSYGNECTTSEIQAQACPEVDSALGWNTNGHGTAVAAVAASTGLATNKYLGVAPSASIIAVKLLDGTENHVIDGTSYIIEKARELGRPVVIDHSLGDSLGSHDGTEPLELAFSDFVAQGIPIVVSAGNDRNQNLHVKGKLLPGEPATVTWNAGKGGNASYVDFWYPVSDILSISVSTPEGHTVLGPTSDSGVVTPEGTVAILADERSTGKEWWINVTAPPNQNLTQSPWSFTIKGVTVVDGKWDAWTEPGQFIQNSNMNRGVFAIDPTDTIDAPGTAHGVITVGSYMTKYSWQALCTACVAYARANSLQGIWYTPFEAPGVGDLAYYSGEGPTRDGRMKPDLTAPGSNIAAARASTATPRLSDPDNYHQVWRGTSFAAPHVAGVIALMLQMNPYLSPNEIKSILTRDARQDQFTGAIDRQVGSPLWGWGKLDALNSTLDAPTVYSVMLEITPIPSNAIADLTLDGQVISAVPLNTTTYKILEFQRGTNHTVSLTPAIQTNPGVRYELSGSPWSITSGKRIKVDYHLQYYLQVTSEYGPVQGTGWYDANSTAVASVGSTRVYIPESQSPTKVYEFRGWSGATNSTSSTVDITMNSSKELVAVWEPTSQVNEAGGTAIIIIGAAAVASIAVAVVVLLLLRRRQPKPASE
jgi:subtilisin family serine protease